MGKRRKKRQPIFEGRMARDCGKRAGNEARKERSKDNKEAREEGE